MHVYRCARVRICVRARSNVSAYTFFMLMSCLHLNLCSNYNTPGKHYNSLLISLGPFGQDNLKIIGHVIDIYELSNARNANMRVSASVRVRVCAGMCARCVFPPTGVCLRVRVRLYVKWICACARVCICVHMRMSARA